eukprot:jgi/Chlat1/2455/Chrsp171S02342
MGEGGASSVLCALTLALISVLAFSIRLFSVVKYEPVIHEFDPYFNYRVSQYMSTEGVYSMWNWFDDRTWYPLGRIIGGTVYPGLMLTAGAAHALLRYLHIPLDITTICVYTAPVFSAFTALAAFFLTKEVKGQGAGLAAAVFVATVPSYISRSVAGSYDYEGVAIFAMLNVFFFYVKTLNTGSLAWGTGLALSYFYMVLCWGGYSFVVNILPIHVLACLVAGKFSSRLYLTYTPLVILGTLLSASVPVVGFNAVFTSEHFGSFFAFAVLQVVAMVSFLKGMLPPQAFKLATALVFTTGSIIGVVVLSAVVALMAASPTLGWTGRSLSLLDPTYASKYIPIIASVSEHQPPAWTSYFMDIHVPILFVPAGILAVLRPMTEGGLFLLLFATTALYFSGVMVRLMLVLAPAACILGGVGLSAALSVLCRSVKAASVTRSDALSVAASEDTLLVDPLDSPSPTTVKSDDKKKKSKAKVDADDELSDKAPKRKRKEKKTVKVLGIGNLPADAAVLGIVLMLAAMCFYAVHCIWVSADAYSAPSIVLQSRNKDGSFHVFDDFRESYAWLRQNTEENDKVASWWDYGYQTTAMANRTVIVDNNTWNNTHIATVGRAMSSPEKKAWRIFRTLDVQYVFVIFGGMVGYPSDDINKFLWMVRIGGGVFPEIKESDYINQYYRVDKDATPTMLNSLMYKLSYYRFAEATTDYSGRSGFDRVRNAEIGKKNIKLKYFEEVFTTQHWMVRIYKLKDLPLRDRNLPNPNRLPGKRRRKATSSRR